MSNISAALVKELRDRTGAGMMECKKALQETNGDIELAIENMRKNGQAKAAKKAGRIAADGIVLARVTPCSKQGFVVELNCETDFVAKDTGFLAFANKVADYVVAEKTSDVEAVKAHFEEERTALVAKIGENITIRRVVALTGEFIGGYTHGSKISALVALTTSNEEAAKKLGMHIASSAPQYVKTTDIPAEIVEKERQIQLDIANQDPSFAKKPAEIQDKILTGRLDKFKDAISLLAQPFVMDPDSSVEAFLKAEGTNVTSFVRVEVGEGIEKKEEDFAAEVAKVTGSFK